MTANITYVISKREKGTDRSIVDAFAVPSDNKDVMETATRWAGDGCRVIKPMPNGPISGVRVVGFERRMEGGRAYKVLIGYNKEWLRVDMRDDIMLDTIMTDGIHPGGILAGTYVWQLHGSQMRLTRVGSQNHLNAVVTKSGVKAKKISPKEFIVGHVYTTPAGQCRDVYLGKLRSLDIGFKKAEGATYDRAMVKYNYSNKSVVTITEKPPRDAWLGSGALREEGSRLVIDYDRLYWDLNLYDKKSYSYIRDVGNVLEGGVKIEDVIAGIKLSATNRVISNTNSDVGSYISYYGTALTLCLPTECPTIPTVLMDRINSDNNIIIKWVMLDV